MTTATIIGPLLEADLDRVRKLVAKADHGGGVWQSWSRILEALELAKIAQDAIAENLGVTVGGPS